MSEFSERLRTARKKKGFSQGKAAKLLNMSASTYNQYETGKHSPNIDFLFHVINKLGIDARELIDFHENEKQPLNKNERELLEMYRSFNKVEQSVVSEIMTGLLKIGGLYFE